jgi:thiamine biosynthesis protein ThiI
MNAILVRFSEIALKGKNRPFFIDRLVENINKATKGYGDLRVSSAYDAVIIECKSNCEGIARRVSKIFGVASAAPAYSVKPKLEDILRVVISEYKEYFAEAKNFRIKTTRSDKNFPKTSVEINKIIGREVVEKYKLDVKLKNPDLTVYISILPKRAFVFIEKFHGPGGLPIGSSGKGLVLLSGGIDSAVSSWKMMRRGMKLNYIHFHALPDTSNFRIVLPTKIVRKLSEPQAVESKIYFVPYHPFQFEIMSKATRFELVIFRRFMLKVAERITKENNIGALITGDSLGQVASQTLENLQTTDSVIETLIFRPLIGENKQDIIDLARKIGIYKLAILDYKDCCSIVDKKPATRSNVEKVEKIEKKLNLEKVLAETIEKIVQVDC